MKFAKDLILATLQSCNLSFLTKQFFLSLQICLLCEEVKTSSTLLDRSTKIKFGKLLLPCLGLGPIEMLENVFCPLNPILHFNHRVLKILIPISTNLNDLECAISGAKCWLRYIMTPRPFLRKLLRRCFTSLSLRGFNAFFLHYCIGCG